MQGQTQELQVCDAPVGNLERASHTMRTISVFGDMSSFENAQRMARALASSTMVPRDYQISQERVAGQAVSNCLIALELSARIGASVFMIMQNLAIVHGKPCWSSQFLIATVNASGKFSPLRWEWQGKPGEPDYGARVVATDKVTDQVCHGSWVTMRLVKAEGWWDRKSRDGAVASKWPTMTEQMFMYRSAAFWVRAYCPEVSIGMHTSEELFDAPAVEQAVVSAVELASAPPALQTEKAVAAEPTPEPPKEPKPRTRSKKSEAQQPADTEPQDPSDAQDDPKPEPEKKDALPPKQPAMFSQQDIDGPEWIQLIREAATINDADTAAAIAVVDMGADPQEVDRILGIRKRQIKEDAKG